MAAAVPSSLLSQLGFYAVLPVLPVLLTETWGVSSPWAVGLALFTLSASMRGASILLSNLLQGVPLRSGVVGALGASAIAFSLLDLVRGPLPVVALLGLAGVGISVSALSLRVFVSESLQSADRRSTVFSTVQVAANVAAAAGPLIGAVLLDLSATVLLLGVASAYAAAALVALVLVPPTVPRQAAGRPPLTARMFLDIVTEPRVRAATVTAATGCFVYAQLFSAISLQLLTVTGSGPLRSSVFVVNAVLVIMLQAPVTRAVNRRLRASTPPFAFLRGGVAVFAGSALVLALGGRSFGGVVAAIVVFSFAETVFTPMLNTVFSEIGGGRSTLEMFNVRQFASAVGESAGTFVGGSVFALSQVHALDAVYWAAVACLGMLVVAAVRRWPPPSQTAHPPVRPHELEDADE